VVGGLDGLPRDVQDELRRGIAETAHLTGLQFSLALNYSGRSEITDVVRRIAGVGEGGDARTFGHRRVHHRAHLFTAHLPEPDLLIRTSGEMRVSNFLLWQIAYAEIWVTDVLWPDFRRRHLLQAIADFQKRERRYGGITAATGKA
jgi:undecaprenyl diphosphate synthase